MATRTQRKTKTLKLDDAAVETSLRDVIKTLSFVSYQICEDSGDYRHAGGGGRRGVYKAYWGNELQFIFLSVWYTLDDTVRASKPLHTLAKTADKLYRQFLADAEACRAAHREGKGPRERIAGLRVASEGRLVAPRKFTLRELVSKGTADHLLIGWERGVPKHLESRADRPVIATSR